MEGIQFVIDQRGKKTAVILDLKMYKKLWEDLEDQILAEKRRTQKRYSHEEVKSILRKEGKF